MTLMPFCVISLLQSFYSQYKKQEVLMRILLIEDNEQLCFSLACQLKTAGYALDLCMDGADAFYYIDQNIYDIILLDCLLPHVDGRTILKKLRARQNATPVIFLTALGELEDKVQGLEDGADDYLVKPFAFEELTARMRCISRRPRKWQQKQVLSFGNLTYDTEGYILTGKTGHCTLSKKEGALLGVFLSNQRQVLPRTTLLSKVWGADAEVEDGNLDNYIYFLRRRLRNVGPGVSIQTIRGIGYRLDDSCPAEKNAVYKNACI